MADNTPIGYTKSVMTENFAKFSGRARRAEFWWFTLVSTVAIVVLMTLGAVIGGTFGGILAVVGGLVALATLIPSIAVWIRRLHDTGRSGWWLLLTFVPFGSIVLLVFAVMDSKREANDWGPSPKYG